MEKPEKLYHGSKKLFKGDRLRPRIPKDLTGRLANSYRAVYSTNIRDIAITFALIKSKGIKCARLDFETRNLPFGIIYEGKIQQEFIYLYTLPSKNFKQDPGISAQWYSKKSIRPLKIEILNVEDYLYLIRKATDEERKNIFNL